MTADRYTKVILTMIAMCLVWIALGGPSLIPPVSAQNDRVYIAGWIDERGAFRPLPIPPGTGRPEAGKAIPSAPLPIFQMNP